MSRLMILAMILATGAAAAQEKHRAALTPLDLKGGKENVFLQNIGQLESDGAHIFVRSTREASVLAYRPDGSLAAKYGGGRAPGYIGPGGVLAMAVGHGQVWGVDLSRGKAHRYEKGRYGKSFALDSYNVLPFTPTSNTFAVSDREIVIPAGPQSGHIAAVYDLDGKFQRHVGDLIPFDMELQHLVMGVNDTLWLFHDEHWYSVHKFFPIVTVYDRQFATVRQFPIESPQTNELLEDLHQFTPTAQNNTPSPIITDAKIHRGHLFLMSGGALHQVDIQSGQVASVTFFEGHGDDFAALDSPVVKLFYFCFLSDNRLVAAHPAMLWNHDLWLTELPFFKES